MVYLWEEKLFINPSLWLAQFESGESWVLSTSTTHSWSRVRRCHYDSIRDMRCGAGDNHPIIGQIWLLTPTPVTLMIPSPPPPSSIIILLMSRQCIGQWSSWRSLSSMQLDHGDILGLITLIGNRNSFICLVFRGWRHSVLKRTRRLHCC